MRRSARWAVGPLVGWSLACGGIVASESENIRQDVIEAPPAPSGPPPNVLVVVLDDVGTDKVAAYGEHPDPPSTPTLDGLAAQGLRFDNAYGYAEGAGTRASLLTGRYARRYGLGGPLGDAAAVELPVDEVTIPEALALAPDVWHSAMVGTWGLSTEASPHNTTHPTDQGFGSFVGTLATPAEVTEWEQIVDGAPQPSSTYPATAVTDAAITAVRQLDEPFFVMVGYPAPQPLHAPPEELLAAELPSDADDADRYDAAIEAVDAELGRLLAALSPAERGRTLVVVLGDNGTARRGIRPPRQPDQAKGSLFEGGVNVPLIVRGPAVPAGGETEALIHAVDLFPTVMELARVDLQRIRRDAAPVDIDGVSQVQALHDVTARPRSTLFLERFLPVGPGPYAVDWRAARDDRYKLVDVGAREPLLYDLSGRDDDGPPLRKAQLTPDEQAHWDALQAEFDRAARRHGYAH